MLGEGESGPFSNLDIGCALGKTQGGLQGLGEPLDHPLLADQPVHDHLNRVLVVTVEFDVFGQVPNLTVDANTGETLLSQILEQSLILPLATSNNRSEDLESGPLLQFENPVHYLLWSLACYRCPVVGTVWNPDTGVEQP